MATIICSELITSNLMIMHVLVRSASKASGSSGIGVPLRGEDVAKCQGASDIGVKKYNICFSPLWSLLN
ncbi:hypothetical protein ACOSQ2_015184 [Xanthoceras sorbifolium]